MFRSLTCAVALCGGVATQSIAATLLATSNSPQNFSDFSIEFDDLNSDGLFNIAELVSFSGVSGSVSSNPVFFAHLLSFPSISNISVGGTNTGVNPVFNNFVSFSIGDDVVPEVFTAATTWSYQLMETPASVPVPASMPLLVFGVASLVTLRKIRHDVTRNRN